MHTYTLEVLMTSECKICLHIFDLPRIDYRELLLMFTVCIQILMHPQLEKPLFPKIPLGNPIAKVIRR